MRFLKLSLVAVFALTLFSCEDVLDNAEPSTAISQENALSSAGGVDAIRNSMYNRLQSFSYATQYMLGPSALADDLASRTGSTRLLGYVENSNGVGMSSWATSYDLINDANLIINGIEDGVLDQAVQDQYQGEAYMLRAFAYHHLVRTFGYEPGMTPSSGGGAGWELGVIIRSMPTLSDTDASYRPRKPVSQVYSLIRDDLDQAISLLSNGDAGQRSYVTLAAVQALRARVELYAGNDQAADDYASDALSNTSASIASAGQVDGMFDETSGLNPESIFEVVVDPSTESLGVNDALSVYTSQQYNAIVPSQDVMDLYDTNDARLAWFGPCFDELSGATGSAVSGCLATHPSIAGGSEELELQKWEAEQGQYADNIPFFRVSEMYLIQAEARVGDATGDPLTPLNTVRTNRGLAALTGAVTLDDVLEEKRREFIGEGQRFFDLKRLGRTIRKPPEITNTNVQDVPYTDYKVLDNIPYNQVSLSESNAPADSVLIQNPGY